MSFAAFLDLKLCPVSYDFVTWLVRARKEAGERSLHVVVIPHEEGLGGFGRHWGEHDEADARWRLWHIIILSCPLAQATVTVAASREQAERIKADPFWWPAGKQHFMAPLVDAARNGEKIPKLRATDAARRYVHSSFPEPFVTLTVRHQSTDPSRNSRIGEWIRLQQHLSQRLRVVWLDDSNDALSAGRGYAELDPDLRMALYEKSRMNFIGNNGPSVMLQLSDAPYRVFLEKGWPEHWRENFHMEIGEQFPWAGADQRVVYEPDTFEVMRKSWEPVTS